MCNIWTNEHIFIWTGSSSTDARMLNKLVCRCGAFHYNGTPANITSDTSKESIRKVLTIREAQKIALDNLYAAEDRRQKEREAEATYWQGMA